MPSRCAGCGAPLDPSALGGLCALCALSDALAFQPAIEPPPCLPFDTLPGDSPPPEILDGYQLIALIARGGMGTVFLARSCSDDTQVAIKLLHGGVYAQDEFKARFRLEAEAIATLSHPSIVRLVRTGEHRGQLFYAMEYVPGPNLRQVTGGAPMNPGKAAAWLLEITEGIAHAHERGILHRDLKPSNILIGPDNHPRITDFGLARRLNEEPHLTWTGAALGTPGYLPPEQISRRWGEVGPRSDVYSLGALLYFLLTGRPPFLAESAVECFRQAEEAEPLNPIRLNPRIPPDLARLCLICLEKEPRYRLPSACDLAADLRRFLKGEAIHTRTPYAWRRTRRFLHRNRRVTVATLGAVACFSIVSGLAARALSLERKARKAAQDQAIRGDAVAQFLREIFDGLDPGQSDGRDTSLILAALRKGVERLEQSYQPYPLVAAELREVFGVAYYRLGQYRESAAMHEAALKLQQNTPQADPVAIADSLYGLGVALWQLNQLPEAQKHLEECLQIRQRTLGEGARATTYARNNLGAVFLRQGRLPEAAALARQNLDAIRKAFGPESCQAAGALGSLGSILFRQGLKDDAEACLSEAVALEERVHGPTHVDVGRALIALALVERHSGRFSEAEAHAGRAVNILTRVAPQHPDHADALAEWAECLIGLQRFTEAEAPLSAALKIRAQTFQETHPSISSLKSALEKVRPFVPLPTSPTNAIQTPP